jgi:hypothetical protein
LQNLSMAISLLEAIFSELLMRKSFRIYEKGIRMIAGMPGTGIGGLCICLLRWMPIRELYFLVRKRTSPKALAYGEGHLFLTGYLIIGMWATGEIIGRLLLHLGAINAHSTLSISHNILRISPLPLYTCYPDSCLPGCSLSVST